jgi:hypothetical protein
VVTVSQEKPLPQIELAAPPPPDPVSLPPVRWKVISTPGGSMIALTPQDYEALSLGLADITRWMKEAASQLSYYRQRIAKPQPAPLPPPTAQ